MKRICAILISLAVPLAAFCAEEDQLLDVLKSGHSLQEKDAACARLKWIGTERSVPALEKLLTDGQLSHSARYALESMKGAEAGNALREALAKTSGSNEVGIINSLGMRGEPASAPDVANLLSSGDADVAVAAAKALGKLNGAEALQAAWEKSSVETVHNAECDGLLACANRLLTDGKETQALKIFRELNDREKNDGIRLAAFRGEILASGERGVALMAEAIAGSDSPSQGAALQLASKVGGPAGTRVLADLLPKLPPPVQIALLQSLAQRDDPSAGPSVVPMIDSSNPDVRLAAITALGNLGDGTDALLLARRAATANGAEKNAARQALNDIRRGQATESMVNALAEAPLDVQLELIRALGERGDSSAAPKILELARSGNDAPRSAVLQALTLLAGPAEVPGLIDLVVKAVNDDSRSDAADALGSVCQHIESRDGQMDAATLVEAVKTAPPDARVALLGVCSGVSDPKVREVLLAAASDADGRVHEAAIRSLCNTHDPKLLPDLLKIACGADQNKFRQLAINGCVRLATQDENAKLSSDTKLDAFKSILDTPLNTPEKRLVLAGLGSVRDDRALALATPLLDDTTVRTEAAQAIIHIAGSISAARPQEAGAALKKVLAMSINPATQKSAERAYKKLQ